MKLHSITLEGFWGYRESVTVEIDGIPLLVAVGHNGSGKSALIVSAVLAGLYGKFPTNTIPESITHGATEGHVMVEFEVNGTLYRVTRSYPRKGASTAAVFHWEDDHWKALTEKGQQEATAKVTELLGMDYDTAITTWVAIQGEYGAFAKAKPAPRFQMLSTVFGLDKYKPMLAAAKKQLKAAQETAAKAEGRVTELNDSLIDDDARDGDQMTDEQLADAITAAHAALDQAASALAAHQQNNPALAVERARTALAAVRDVRLANLRAAEEALTDLRAARDREPARRDSLIADANARYDRDVNTATARYERDAQAQTAEADHARAALAVAADAASRLEEARTVAVQAETDLNDAATVVTEAAALVGEATLGVERANTALTAAQNDVADAYDALDVLAHEGDCYACGQHISESIARALHAAQKKVIADAEALVQTRITEQAAAVTALDGAKAAHADALAAEVAAQTQATTAALLLRDVEAAASLASQHQAALDAATARLTVLGAERDEALAVAAADRDQAIASAEKACTENLAAIAKRGKDAAAYAQSLKAPTAEELELDRDLTAAENLAAGDSRYQAETERLTAARDQARAEATALDAEQGRRAEVARRQAEQAARIDEAKKALSAAQDDVTLYTDLVAAYSPSGIPTMILESVIDDLNAAINVTLADLSAGALEVRLSTSRETAGGTTESKVTVYVDTPTGPRSYEALSGGQKFRVDLAIRMGLSTIISRGTGIPVETFILDEGWGSLDEAGIRSTLEVLGRLSDQVNVLTVSHVDTVRESFPARIEVSTAEGTSQAVVVR